MKKLLLILMISLTPGFAMVASTSAAPSTPVGDGGGSQQLEDASQCQPTEYATCLDEPIPDPALKADPNNNLKDCGGSGQCNLVTKYLNPFINVMAVLVGVAVTIGIIRGGILYSSSAGDPQKSARARDLIRNSVIALLAFFFLFTFLQFIIPGKGLLQL